jgi:hypothetical protein
MTDQHTRFDDLRAVTVTDTVAALSLIAFALIIGGGLGVGLVFPGGGGGDTGAPSANFTFEYLSQANTVFATLNSGGPIPGGELVVVAGETEKTWAAVAEENNSTMIERGDTIPLGPNSPFGAPINAGDQVIVRWDDGNETKRLDNFTAGN